MTICKNCKKEVAHLYCPHCGQKIEQQITIKVALEDMLRGITNGDSGVFLTIKELFTRPGKMIVEYLDGRRAIHFRPFPLLILLTGVVMVFDGWAESLHLQQVVVEVPSEDTKEFNWSDLTPIQAMMYVPFFAVASRVLFGKGYNLIEHMYITAFATIQRQIVLFVVISIASVFINLDENDAWRFGLYTCALIPILALTYWDYKQIFKRSRWGTFWRVIMIFILAVVAMSIGLAIYVTLIVAIEGAFKLLFS